MDITFSLCVEGLEDDVNLERDEEQTLLFSRAGDENVSNEPRNVDAKAILLSLESGDSCSQVGAEKAAGVLVDSPHVRVSKKQKLDDDQTYQGTQEVVTILLLSFLLSW